MIIENNRNINISYTLGIVNINSFNPFKKKVTQELSTNILILQMKKLGTENSCWARKWLAQGHGINKC